MDRLPDLDERLQEAANTIRSAEAILIGAGAGMGVDSGLPDFRGPEGFWKAYPPFRGRAFSELSTPHWFQTDPAFGLGFFRPPPELVPFRDPPRRFSHTPSLVPEPAAWKLRVHEQRRRSIPKGWVSRGWSHGATRIDPLSPVLQAVRQVDLVGRQRALGS